jgi:hypothetical protein
MTAASADGIQVMAILKSTVLQTWHQFFDR